MCYKPRKQKTDFSGGRQNSFTYENLIHGEKEKRHCINNARKNEKYIFKHILKMASNICKCAVQSSRDPGAIGRKQAGTPSSITDQRATAEVVFQLSFPDSFSCRVLQDYIGGYLC